MFAKKIGLMVIGVALAMFAMGRGSTAWAQSWDDSGDDAASESQPTTLPDIAGSYTGSVQDHRFGSGSISATISQGGPSGGVLSGSWSTDVGGGVTDAPLKGKVKPNNAVTLRLKIRGNCHLVAHGTFENGDEIVGVYHAAGCGGPDHGTFDITD
jgi:hypothetical protein